jgi:hypothetical protein
MPFSNPIVGGTTLVRPAIKSPNYSAGSAGWSINKDGSAEFNNIVIRSGEVISGTALYYSGTPAAGNLIMSIAAAAGVDDFGNAYPKGLSIGNTTTRQIVLNYDGNLATINFSANNGHGNTSGSILEIIQRAGQVDEYLAMQIIGPTIVGHTDRVSLALNSQNLDGSSNANFNIQHTSGDLATFDNNGVTTFVPFKSNGNATVLGVLKAANRITDKVSITPSAANVPTSVTVTFPTPLTGTNFTCQVTPNTINPQDIVSWSYSGLSATGVTIWLVRSNTTATNMNYTVEGN